ncbi:DUF475 domain-containing protein [Actinomadura rudentiformis]|uniref:DUF475 domain-containing protein n=1 Tax=Actinomadura rudentiformis TaxID=359158 RepID=A0A6H9YSQ9_9ACTN|nr:DUF475 domain-containing protein [Actinomadura rudentiformis]KAB2351430.1 DUF475 domain-containing protein [Actinomadura rudentiformis]
MILRTFGWSFALTAAGLVAALAYGGTAGLAVVTVLVVLEISLSFDNAVVNAKVLERMSPFWQKIFLTVGIAIAVFGMRLLFPVAIVALTTGLGPVEAVRLALNDHDAYQASMESAYPMIAAFGGVFLLMIFLDWLFDEREERWLALLEAPLARFGRLDQLSVIIAGTALAGVAGLWAPEGERASVLIAGMLGLVAYLLVNGLGNLFDTAASDSASDSDSALASGSDSAQGSGSGPSRPAVAVGKAAFFLFLYLEVLDASFSFDGVIGAFAISTDPIVIALGLGIGAIYIRSITVFLIRKGTLQRYAYLEHGAHWAIGALAVCMLVGIVSHVPEWITGGLGAGLIILAFATSVLRNRRAEPEPAPVTG